MQQPQKEKQTKRSVIHDISFTIMLMADSTALSFLMFDFVENSSPNIALIYMLALILTARYTHGYLYGLAAALFYVVCINFLFTFPYFEVNFTLTGYPVTFLIMLAVTIITSAITTHSKIQSELLAESELAMRNAEKEKMRANLLRAVSHDLRTPLTSIIGTASSLLEENETSTPASREQLLSDILEDSNWLLNMVENLLSVTRIETSSAKVTKSEEVVEEVVSEAVLRFRKRQPQAKVKVDIPKEFLLVAMDPLLIEQVLINLLENAYFHSQSTLPIELFIQNEPDFTAFLIRDYGIGISPDKLDTIFDGTADRSICAQADTHRGMGIGLSICKTVIDAHNGTIEARNHKEGAEFIFRLPKGENK